MVVAAIPASTTHSAHTLAGRDLRLDRGTRTIISGLTFEIASGQALVLRGANGSGKTSLLRILAGLTIPDAGAVLWNGERLKALSSTWRSSALYLGHTNALKDDFTAQENLVDALSIDGINVEPTAQLAALERVGLLDRRRVLARRLSQGKSVASALRACLWRSRKRHANRCGCWMNRPTRLMARVCRYSRGS